MKCPIFVPDFKQIWIFLTDFHEIVQYKILRKYVQWETDGHDEDNSRFCDCMKAPKILFLHLRKYPARTLQTQTD